MYNRRRWKPSKNQAIEYSRKIDEIIDFCIKNNIARSHCGDSYYFRIDGVDYRVSNHAIESSKFYGYNGEVYYYHDKNYRNEAVCIHASKLRIIEIYNNLKAGKKLDGKGNVKE